MRLEKLSKKEPLRLDDSYDLLNQIRHEIKGKSGSDFIVCITPAECGILMPLKGIVDDIFFTDEPVYICGDSKENIFLFKITNAL